MAPYSVERLRKGIKRVMKIRGFKPAPFGKKAGMSKSALRMFLEDNTHSMTAENIGKLANIAHFPVGVLYGDAAPDKELDPSENRQLFAGLLKRVRLKSASSGVRKFAAAAGIKVADYKALERGEREPTIDDLCGIIETVDVSLDYLVGGVVPPRGFTMPQPLGRPSDLPPDEEVSKELAPGQNDTRNAT